MALNAKDHQSLWKLYAATKDQSIRETLIVENAYLIKYVAGRLNIYFSANLEYDDLVSFGVFGLIDAIDKFDPNKGVKFETYASLRIRGAIIDNIRELDWAPRSLRQKGKVLEKACVELEIALGRPPEDEEIAEKLGLSMAEFAKFVSDASISTLVSLEEVVEQNGEYGEDPGFEDISENPAKQAEYSEMKEMLSNEIELLSEKEKTVITFYYFKELTLKEISAIMKVSESRISQLHTKAIAKLRGSMTRHMSYFKPQT
jgi:RNA polymerase sigma factor for flagellar operon FliA